MQLKYNRYFKIPTKPIIRIFISTKRNYGNGHTIERM